MLYTPLKFPALFRPIMRYYKQQTLKGFDSYKYRALDTSPLSVYVMHPYWDWVVQFYPRWLAPNLLTFLGFLLVSFNFLLTCHFDWNFYASSPNHKEVAPIPQWVWFVMFVCHFASHTLDGTDGKQAKRTKSSSPLGELFDHGVDSLSTVFMPVALFSIFGRSHEFGGNAMDMHFVTWCIFLTFAFSHWEKYNTQELYLPWSYDIALLGIALVYLLTGLFGVEMWRWHLFGSHSVCSVMIKGVYIANFAFSLPVSVYNIYSKYSPVNQLKYGFLDGLAPLFSIAILASLSTMWMLFSRNDIAEKEPRMFLWHQGVLFSSHVCRLIIAQMTSTKVNLINWLLYPYVLLVSCMLLLPSHSISLQVELNWLYAFAAFVTLAHVHFGVCVVREIASYLKVSVFSIKKAKS